MFVEPEIRAHPAADAFPLMTPKQFDELRADIKARGLREPIKLYQEQILDGRNRYKACLDIPVEPRFVEVQGNPFDEVWSLNGQRRDLTAAQRYLIWAELSEKSEAWETEQQRIKDEANRKRSEAQAGNKNASKEENSGGASSPATESEADQQSEDRHPARAAKAEASASNSGAVKRMDQLRRKRPDLAEKVKSGEMTATNALRIMRHDDAKTNLGELPKDKFRVIYADPPWKYGNDGLDNYGHAGRHYPSMSITELTSLAVRDIVHDNAVLFMWVTSPFLEDSFQIIKAWGFSYKTSFVWDKVKHNFGHYNSVRHELLLVCTRGSCLPDNASLHDSVVQIERSKTHSEKPEYFRQIIDSLYPLGTRIELFARGHLPEHWVSWGCESVA